MRELTRRPTSWFQRRNNVRRTKRSEAESRALGEGMRDEGQIEPVVARPNGDLIAGYGRLDAAMLVGLKDLEVIITDEVEDEGAETLCAAQENWLRQDLGDVDKVYIVERLRTLYPNWLAKHLAERLHVDPSTITKLMSVSKVIPAVREAFEAGAITLSHVYQFSKLDPQQQHQLLPNAVNGATRETIEQEGRKRRNGTAPPVRSSRIKIPLPSGATIVISGQCLSLGEVIECLSSVLESAKKGDKEKLDARTWQSVMRDRAKAVANA
jgi:ParB family transcriptional regulator, chromosome partitioning protein